MFGIQRDSFIHISVLQFCRRATFNPEYLRVRIVTFLIHNRSDLGYMNIALAGNPTFISQRGD